MAPLRIFISYRRDSDLLRASLVVNQLENAFNRRHEPRIRIFRDTRLPVGQQWPNEIQEELKTADIVMVLIGPGWLGAKDQFERRRIDQPDDWVRKEIELALHGAKSVIPIAFEESLPPREALPQSIAPLVDWQAAVVRDGNSRKRSRTSSERGAADSTGPVPVRRGAEGGRLPYPRPPMKFPPAPMPEADLALVVVEELPMWDVVKGPVEGKPGLVGVELHRDFKFRRFSDVVPFMSTVADFADKANHHPRWENVYKTLSVRLTTWDIQHQVSSLDLMLASFIDKTYDEYLGSNAA